MQMNKKLEDFELNLVKEKRLKLSCEEKLKLELTKKEEIFVELEHLRLNNEKYENNKNLLNKRIDEASLNTGELRSKYEEETKKSQRAEEELREERNINIEIQVKLDEKLSQLGTIQVENKSLKQQRKNSEDEYKNIFQKWSLASNTVEGQIQTISQLEKEKEELNLILNF